MPSTGRLCSQGQLKPFLSDADSCPRREDLCRSGSRNYSRDKDNVGHARGRIYMEAMLDVYRACVAITKPGGFVVVVTKNTRSRGAMRNLAGETVALCQRAGLECWQHVVALLATMRGDELIPRPSLWQIL